MKRTGKIASIAAVVGIMALTGASFAGSIQTPAEIVSSLTGKSVATLQAERSEGKTYGSIAKDAGKLDSFQAQVLEQKKLTLDERVKEGRMTQAEADKIYSELKTNQASCGGTGSERIGQKYGAGFGTGTGHGTGHGQGLGNGQHRGAR